MSQLHIERDGGVAILKLDRAAKRNALSDPLVRELGGFFDTMPKDVRAVVIAGNGEHFCAGLDLSDLNELDAYEGAEHSRTWHRIFDNIQFGRVPVVAALQGAVIGGGLELACCAHVRVADATAFYALPEGQRGIFVGGGGSVRVPRLIGVSRMTDMMLTGRVYRAEEGERIGLAQYLVEAGAALPKAIDLAQKIAANATMTNYAVVQALPRIAEASHDGGLYLESMIAGITQASPEAKAKIKLFLDGKAKKVGAA